VRAGAGSGVRAPLLWLTHPSPARPWALPSNRKKRSKETVSVCVPLSRSGECGGRRDRDEGPPRRGGALCPAPAAGPFSPAVPPSDLRGNRSGNRGRASGFGGKPPESGGKPLRSPGNPSRSAGSRSGNAGNLPSHAGKRPGNAGNLPGRRGKPSRSPGRPPGIGGNFLALWGKPLRSADFGAESSQPCEPNAQDSSGPFPPYGKRSSPPSLQPGGMYRLGARGPWHLAG
jgi:hypothetical protein